MELLDVYDAKGKKTGAVAPRGTQLPDGKFFLCTHVILEDMEHRYLIQQRSDTKPTRPGQWDITAGAVDAGENSLEAAQREAQEEIGLCLPKEKFQFLFRDVRNHCYHDVWYIQEAFQLTDCVMQESEVQALKLVEPEELIQLVSQMPHRSENYKKCLSEFLQNQKTKRMGQ